jgi:hypothetical protein
MEPADNAAPSAPPLEAETDPAPNAPSAELLQLASAVTWSKDGTMNVEGQTESVMNIYGRRADKLGAKHPKLAQLIRNGLEAAEKVQQRRVGSFFFFFFLV